MAKKLLRQVADISRKILIPNWFDRETLGELVGEDVKREDFKTFITWFEDGVYADAVSEQVRDAWKDYKRTNGDVTKI